MCSPLRMMRTSSSTSPSSRFVISLLLFLFYSETDAFSISYPQNQSCSSNDLRALHAFSQSLDTKIHGWPLADADSGSCCSWPGVHCGPLSDSHFSLDSTTPTVVRVIGLNLSGMGLQGFLPISISGLDELTFLNLSKNSFRGSISPELFHLKLLEVLDLSSNHFSGELPLGIRNLSGLRHLDVSNNRFTGGIPDAFQDLPRLEVFMAESNTFTGALPTSLSSCSNLTILSMWNNSLQGSIDLNFTRLLRLTKLDLGRNQLHGLIPEALSSCESLKILHLPWNKLSGQIPKKLSKLKSLYFLNVFANDLSNISMALEVLQECHNLTVLILSGNFQGEKIPTTGIRGLRKLRLFGVANCALTGSFPSWLRNSIELRALFLGQNHLSGEIPAWIGDLVYLFVLNLSDNLLHGDIPISLTGLKSIATRITFNDDVSFYDPPMFKLKNMFDIEISAGLEYKHYTGFPPSLNLSHNKLTGSIWKEFGNLKYLHHLDLSWNNLSGPIPEELSGMINLEKLDLSFNNLSGSIHSSFAKLTFLSSFNVANNHLEGLIPSGGQFSSFPCSSFEGNPRLHSNFPPFCNSHLNTATYQKEGDVDDGGGDRFVLFGSPFAIGLAVGFLPTVYLSMLL